MSSQNHRLSFRSHGLLMELTFVCGFFAVAACVFVNSKAVGNAVLKLEAVR